MNKLLRVIFGGKRRARRTVGGETRWMRGQLQQMTKMNQGVISGSLGK